MGSTNNIKRRFFEHNSGKACSTRSKRPWSIESYIVVKTEKQARSLEQYFKTGSGKTLLKKRILGDSSSSCTLTQKKRGFDRS